VAPEQVVREESYRVVSRVPLQQVRRVCGRAQAMEHSKSWLQNVLPASTEVRVRVRVRVRVSVSVRVRVRVRATQP